MKNLIHFLLLALAPAFFSCKNTGETASGEAKPAAEPAATEATAQTVSNGETLVMIETDMGNIKVKLYDSTPKHRDNFIKLAKEGYYDGTLFHRVMPDFMIQGGDPDSKNAVTGQRLGQGGPGYEIDPEFGAYHFRGALAAARKPDQVNPGKKSSGSQFYIVQAGPVQEPMLNQIIAQKGLKYTPEQRQRYLQVGGYPPLDNDYTVFGEVVEGLDVVDKIAAAQRDRMDRPAQDIKMKVKLL
ncbi:MAG: peptidylprolyl isomerase [Bacteroidota bacterium]